MSKNKAVLSNYEIIVPIKYLNKVNCKVKQLGTMIQRENEDYFWRLISKTKNFSCILDSIYESNEVNKYIDKIPNNTTYVIRDSFLLENLKEGNKIKSDAMLNDELLNLLQKMRFEEIRMSNFMNQEEYLLFWKFLNSSYKNNRLRSLNLKLDSIEQWHEILQIWANHKFLNSLSLMYTEESEESKETEEYLKDAIKSFKSNFETSIYVATLRLKKYIRPKYRVLQPLPSLPTLPTPPTFQGLSTSHFPTVSTNPLSYSQPQRNQRLPKSNFRQNPN